MYHSFDNKYSSPDENEVIEYEYNLLKRKPIRLSLNDIVKYHITDYSQLDRVIDYEIPVDHSLNMKSVIIPPCNIMTFADLENKTFHVISESKASQYLCDYINKYI